MHCIHFQTLGLFWNLWKFNVYPVSKSRTWKWLLTWIHWLIFRLNTRYRYNIYNSFQSFPQNCGYFCNIHSISVAFEYLAFWQKWREIEFISFRFLDAVILEWPDPRCLGSILTCFIAGDVFNSASPPVCFVRVLFTTRDIIILLTFMPNVKINK